MNPTEKNLLETNRRIARWLVAINILKTDAEKYSRERKYGYLNRYTSGNTLRFLKQTTKIALAINFFCESILLGGL